MCYIWIYGLSGGKNKEGCGPLSRVHFLFVWSVYNDIYIYIWIFFIFISRLNVLDLFCRWFLERNKGRWDDGERHLESPKQ